MKIVWATPYCQPSAIGRFSAIVVKALRARGHTVAVYRTEADESLELPPIENAHIVDSVTPEGLAYIRSADIVFGNVGDHFGFHGRLLSLMETRPVVGILHDWYVLGLMWGWRRSLKDEAGIRTLVRSLYGEEAVSIFDASTAETMMRNAATHFPMTEWITGDLAGAIIHSEFYRGRVEASCPGPVEKISLAYPAPPIRKGKPGSRKAGRFALRTFGVVNPNKCVDLVIKAIGEDPVLRESIDYRVLGKITDEDRRRLTELAGSFGYDGLALEGAVSQSRLHAGMAEADAICCLRNPALEGASASAIEGMQSGAPVIVTDTGFYADLPDDCVLKVPLDDEIHALREHLHWLISNPEEGRRLSDTARAWASVEFSAESYASRLESVMPVFIGAEPFVVTSWALGRELGRMNVPENASSVRRVAELIDQTFSLNEL